MSFHSYPSVLDDPRLAREGLGLTVNEMAELVRTTPGNLRRWEMTGNQQNRRKPNPQYLLLLDAYLAGYRPNNWPERLS